MLPFVLYDYLQTLVYIYIRLQTPMHASVTRVQMEERATKWAMATSAAARKATQETTVKVCTSYYIYTVYIYIHICMYNIL